MTNVKQQNVDDFGKIPFRSVNLLDGERYGEKKQRICQFKYKPQYFENQLPMDTKVGNSFLLITLEQGGPERSLGR